MPEYAKMKNVELESLLKTRGLPTGGKKADMVDRLTKDDEKSGDGASKSAALHPEDEIDWDDDGEDAPAEAAKPAAATDAPASNESSTTVAEAEPISNPNPQAIPNQVADIDPSKTDDLSVKEPAEENTEVESEAKVEEEKKEPPPDYTKGLAASSLDAEIEKRKARAKKFGLNIEEDEGLKKLERMKKFGETGPPKGLDEALSDRTKKRGREDIEEGGRNKRRGGGNERRGRGNQGGTRGGDRRGERGEDRRGERGEDRRGGDRGGDRRRDNRDGRDTRERGDNRREERRDDRPRNGGFQMSAEDKAKADARKAKWATPAASS
jgi:SAP domain-containing ribonucleoprotein